MVPTVIPGDELDRRRRPRLRLAYPLRLYRPEESSAFETSTEDISCEGFYCFTHKALVPTETLICELLIPGDAQQQPPAQEMVLRCRVEVVRVVPPLNGKGFGVAFRLADYSVGSKIVERGLARHCVT